MSRWWKSSSQSPPSSSSEQLASLSDDGASGDDISKLNIESPNEGQANPSRTLPRSPEPSDIAQTSRGTDRPSSLVPLPETMSCRQTFDHAFYCQSFGGQFVSVYRYGNMQSCSEQWSDFWFCMRMRSSSEDVKKQAIRERYWKKEEKYRTGPSSEDIWDERQRRVERAFDLDPDKAGVFQQVQDR